MSETEKRAETNAAATAAPRPLALGGKVYLLHPPTPRDNAAIVLECAKHRPKRTAFAALLADPAFHQLPERLQSQAVTVATQTQVSALSTPDLTLGELLDALGQPKALAFAVWLLARREHPQTPLAEIQAAVTEDNAGEVLQLFLDASGMAGLGPEGNSAGRAG